MAEKYKDAGAASESPRSAELYSAISRWAECQRLNDSSWTLFAKKKKKKKLTQGYADHFDLTIWLGKKSSQTIYEFTSFSAQITYVILWHWCIQSLE